MNKIFELIIATGIFFIIGVAGSTDLGVITLMETLIYISIGMGIIFIGFVGYKKTAKEVKQK